MHDPFAHDLAHDAAHDAADATFDRHDHAPPTEDAPTSPAGLARSSDAPRGAAADLPARLAALADLSQLIERVHLGEVAPESLPPDVRRDCIEHLAAQGFTTGDITRVLRMSERTVRRDRAATRAELAQPPDLSLGDQLLGEFQRVVRESVQRLIQVARDPSSPGYVRVWAEQQIVTNHHRLLEAARRMEYLDPGSRRLEQQRRADPAEHQRQRDAMSGFLKMMNG